MDLTVLSAKMDMCITRAEVAAVHAERAGDASARTEVLAREMKTVLTKIATDHVSLRHGIPASWSARLAFVGVAALFGALASLSVAACGH